MLNTSLAHPDALERYGLEPFGTFTINSSGETSLTFQDQRLPTLNKGIYAWLIQDEIVRIGSCKGTLGGRAKHHDRWIQMRLNGTARISDPQKLQKQTDEAKRWQAALAGGKSAILWGRQGTIVDTPIGPLNAYLAEENALLEAYKPKFNNSHFR